MTTTSTQPRFSSFEEYLDYDDGTECCYELYNGELIALPPESGWNVQIAGRLSFAFALLLGSDRVRGNGLEIEVRGEPRNRYPDLTIIREAHILQLAQRNTIRLAMAPPDLVVEVVSPGEIQRHRDYIAKRQQYEDRGIPEYWILNPETRTVLVLTLHPDQTGIGRYTEAGIFQGNEPIGSALFPALQLLPAQIFA